MFNLTVNQKIQIHILVSFALFGLTLTMNFSWLWLAGTYVSWFILKVIGGEVGAHKYFAHRSYTTTRAWELFLIFAHFWVGENSMLSFVTTHRQHHAYTETPRDPHSPRYSSWADIMFWRRPFDIDMRFARDVVRDSAIVFTHRYYYHIHLAVLFLCLVLGAWIFYAYILAGVVVINTFQNYAFNYLCHQPWVGYQNYLDKDDSRNSRWLMYVTFGSGLHNNHHGDPGNYSFKLLPGEYDFTAWFIDRWVRT